MSPPYLALSPSPGRSPLAAAPLTPPGHTHPQMQPSLRSLPAHRNAGLAPGDPRSPVPPGGDREERLGGPGRATQPSPAQPPRHPAAAVTQCPVTWGGPTLRNPPGAPRCPHWVHLGHRGPGVGGRSSPSTPQKGAATAAHSHRAHLRNLVTQTLCVQGLRLERKQRVLGPWSEARAQAEGKVWASCGLGHPKCGTSPKWAAGGPGCRPGSTRTC